MAWRALSHVSKVHIINSLAAVKHGGDQGVNLVTGGALSMTVADRTDGRCNFIKVCPGAVGYVRTYKSNPGHISKPVA